MKILILLPVLLPLILSFVIYLFKKSTKAKNITILSTLIATFLTCLINCFLSFNRFDIIQIFDYLLISFNVDNLGRFFTVLISFIWIIVFVYTFEYIKHEGHENRFYTFMLLTLAMLIALCYAYNLPTMYICFEMVTLLSMPLVLHSFSKESINAAKKYLFYSIGGAFLALFGLFYLIMYCPDTFFDSYGGLNCFKSFVGNQKIMNVAIFACVVGFGTKAGMFPLQGWLPIAHPVAPSSASSVLSGVITKAGVIAIIRVIYYIVGPDFILNTWVQYTWVVLACITILLGSLLAYFEDNLKKRLAYSSISQISYILVSLALLSEYGFIGALLQVAAHMLIKVCLFLFAGELIYKFDIKNVSKLKGIGKVMPISLWCFTIASLGLIGIPFTIGFVSKWNIAVASINSNLTFFNYFIPIVLLISAILTAAYLLPITFNGFFKECENKKYNEASPIMYCPLIVLSVLIVLLGIISSPLIDIIQKIV